MSAAAGPGWESDGRGSFELSAPRTESGEEYRARVPERERWHRFHEALRRREDVPERRAVGRIDGLADLIGQAEAMPQAEFDYLGWGDKRERIAEVRDGLAEAKRDGRALLAQEPAPVEDSVLGRLAGQARRVLVAAVREESDAVAELERHAAVTRWAADDEVARADAGGALDGWTGGCAS